MTADAVDFIARLGAAATAFFQAELLYSTVLFVPLWLLLRLFRKRSPHLQLGLCALLLLRLVIPPQWASPLSARHLLATWQPFQDSWQTISGLLFAGSVNNAGGTIAAVDGIHTPRFNDSGTAALTDSGQQSQGIIPTLLFLAWLCGTTGFSVIFLRHRRRYHRLVSHAGEVTDPAILAIAARWRRTYRIARPVRLCSADNCATPFTLGIFRPVIFLPHPVVAPKNPRLVETVIAHEMAHIRRYDDLWIRLQALLQVIYFFHPLVWYANRQLNQARERICDRMVLSRRQISPRDYGEGMLAILRLNLAGANRWGLHAGFGSNHQYLIQRIQDIKGGNVMKQHHRLISIAILALTGLFLLPMASYQSLAEDRPAAETPPAAAGPAFTCPIKAGYVSSGYGERIHPVKKVKMLHKGIDVAAPRGSEIYAAAAGTVISSKFMKNYGNTVILHHADGYTTLYSQMDSILATAGQQVDAGTLIGLVGDSGLSTAPHLHFELRLNDEALDPESMIDFGGLKKKDGN